MGRNSIHRYGYIRYHCRYGSMGYDSPYLREKKVVPRLAGGRRPDADWSGTGSLDTLSRRSGAKISSRQWKAFSRRYMSLLQNRCIKVIYHLRPDIVSMDNEWYWWLACSYPPRDRQLTRNTIHFPPSFSLLYISSSTLDVLPLTSTNLLRRCPFKKS